LVYMKWIVYSIPLPNYPWGSKGASAGLSFEHAIEIAGEEGDNYRAKFRQ